MCLASLSIQFILWQESSLDRTCRFMFSNQNVKILKILQIENFTKFCIRFHKMRGDNSSAPSFSASLCSLCTENNSLASDFMFSLSLTCGFKCCWRNISRYTYVEQSIFFFSWFQTLWHKLANYFFQLNFPLYFHVIIILVTFKSPSWPKLTCVKNH